jgi:UDP-glucuronate 4-epimerase
MRAKILVTGAAGFIGMHTVKALLAKGHQVIGIDNINAYYDVTLKLKRLAFLGIDIDNLFYNKPIVGDKNFTFVKLDLTDSGNVSSLFAKEGFEVVINLAAQAGVRYSITNPQDYISSNIVGFFNLIEACRANPVKHFIYASSSSVYGNSSEIPFTTEQMTDAPISLYAATKKSNELMAHTYAHLYKIPSTGLRFFTVYGPWGRPDMAYFLFTKKIFEGKSIQVFANGLLKRDFTYVNDIVESISRLISFPPSGDSFHRILNIGNSSPVSVNHFIQTLERLIGKDAVKEFLPMQAGDVELTFADTSPIELLTNFSPCTNLEDGLRNFVEWYKAHFLSYSNIS